jgi:hypothetical protein
LVATRHFWEGGVVGRVKEIGIRSVRECAARAIWCRTVSNGNGGIGRIPHGMRTSQATRSRAIYNRSTRIGRIAHGMWVRHRPSRNVTLRLGVIRASAPTKLLIGTRQMWRLKPAPAKLLEWRSE